MYKRQIQWDALLAEQFDMYYIDENGDKKRPCIIHRTSMGCYERTLAWLIEKYAGMFPTWLCPEQVRVIPISEKFNAYADKVEAQMKEAGIRLSLIHICSDVKKSATSSKNVTTLVQAVYPLPSVSLQMDFA